MAIPVLREVAEIFDDDTMYSNPGLVFSRFAAPTETGDRWKKKGLKHVIKCKADPDVFNSRLTRWNAVTAAGGAGEPQKMRVEWRFVTGLGAKGAYEIGFLFDSYGIPYLPGSSVKGIARAAARLLFDLDETDADFLTVFGEDPQPGSNGAAGKAIFFDAIPDSRPDLALDVMNPHHSDYYSRKETYPVTWEDPIPIYFLTVKHPQKFLFAVGWRERPVNEDLRDKAREWLKAGLEDLGAGAKTGAGYGYWEEVLYG